MPTRTVTRRAHTYTLNGKTHHRRASAYQTHAVLGAKVIGASIGFGILSAAGLSVGWSALIVGGAWFAIANRKKIAHLSRQTWRASKKVGRGVKRTVKATRTAYQLAQVVRNPPMVRRLP